VFAFFFKERRQTLLKQLATEDGPCYFESPVRLLKTLEILSVILALIAAVA